jgi:LysM repeat protein
MMQIKRLPLFLTALLLILVLAACVRPASRVTTGETTPTGAGGEFPLPSTSDVMGQLEVFATQTALSLSGVVQPTPVEEQAPVEGQTPPAEGQTPVEGQTPAEGQAPVTETPAGAAEATPAAPEQPAEATPEPQAPTNTPAPIPPLTVPDSYRLRGGEFPFCIARRFNVDPGELLSLNGLGPNSASVAGMTLQIPKTGNPFPGERALRAHPTTYNVRAGDTVNSIACLFGDVDPNAILAVNGLGEGQELQSGQTLQIP